MRDFVYNDSDSGDFVLYNGEWEWDIPEGGPWQWQKSTDKSMIYMNYI